MTTGSGPSDGPVGEASAKGFTCQERSLRLETAVRCSDVPSFKSPKSHRLVRCSESNFQTFSSDDFTTES